MQLSADITGRPVKVAASQQAPALGSAMFAAVAAGPELGGYGSIVEASQRMARLGDDVYLPDEASKSTYDDLYSIFKELHDTMAGSSSPMRRLRTVQATTREAMTRETRVVPA
jgi:L-ribulokinase